MVKIERCVLCGPKKEDEIIAHFGFPNTKLADQWKQYCTKVDPTKLIFLSSKLCCIHFEEKSFTSLKGRHVLRKDAIPSIIPSCSESENMTRKCNHERVHPKSPENVAMSKNYGLHTYMTHCTSCRLKRKGVASFHFPKEENIREQWIEFCQIDRSRINIYSRLCHHHFTENDFLVSKSGRVKLKDGTIPSIRVVPSLKRNKVNNAEEMVVEADLNISHKIPELCSETRCDEPTSSSNSSILCENDNKWFDLNEAAGASSTCEMFQFAVCSLCKTTSPDVVQFQFAKNTSMRSVLTTICGMSPSSLDGTNFVCISHFDDDDVEINNDGKMMIKDGAFPWCYLSLVIAKSSNNTPELPIPEAGIVQSPSAATSNEIVVTPEKLVRKRKSYVGDMSPSDFGTPKSAERNLKVIKEKFRAVKLKVKRLQSRNRWADQRMNKILNQLRTLNDKDLITFNDATTVYDFPHDYVRMPQI